MIYLIVLMLALATPASAAQTYLRWTGEAPDPTTITPLFDSSTNCTVATPGTAVSGTRVIDCNEPVVGCGNEGKKVVQFSQTNHAKDAGGAFFSAWYYLADGFDDLSAPGVWRNNMQWKFSGGSVGTCSSQPEPNCARCKAIMAFTRRNVPSPGPLQVSFSVSECGTATVNNAGVTVTNNCLFARTTPLAIPLQEWFHIEVYYKASATGGAIKVWQTVGGTTTLLFDLSGASFNTLTRTDPCIFSNPDLFWTVGCYTCQCTSDGCTGIEAHRIYADDLMITDFQVSSSPPSAPQAFLTASSNNILNGGTVDLAWDGLFADACTIDQGVGSVCANEAACTNGGSSTGLTPSSTLTYTLTCTNEGGSATASQTVTVASARPRYTIYRMPTSPTPVVDNSLAEFAGADLMSLLGQQTGARTRMRMLWDDTALYLACEVFDKDMNANLATQDAALYDEDSCEWLFDTARDLGAAQDADDFKLILNGLNTQYDEVGGSATPDPVWTSAVSRVGTNANSANVDYKYRLEARITWASLTSAGIATPSGGTIWGCDFAQNNSNPSTVSQGGGMFEKTIWANIDGGSPNNPNGWGECEFSSTSATTRRRGSVGGI